ncbi:MAG: hypothetical protein ABL953_13455 [Ilumatobacteraceae bacterium]
MKHKSVVLCFLATTLVACSGSDSTSSDGSADTTAGSDGLVDPESVLDPVTEELSAIREANDGYLPLQDSLDLFASTFGELPGGDAGRFVGGEGNGSMALHAVARFWDQLSVDQVAAVQSVLGYTPLSSSLVLRAASPPDPALQREVDAQRATIATRLGIDVPFPIVGYLVPGLAVTDGDHVRAVGGLAISEREGSIVGTGSPDRCAIKFAAEDPLTANDVAHEVFHCFQMFLAGDLTTFYAAQHWITEGSAEWVQNDVAGSGGGAQRNFQTWTFTDSSLYAMSYQAIGYYWVLDSLGVSPYQVIDEMLVAGGALAAVAASGLDPIEVLARASTSRARAHTVMSLPVSERWDFTSSRVPRFGYHTEYTVTPSDGLRRVTPLPNFAMGTAAVFRLDGGNVVRVSVEGEVGTLEFFGKDPIGWSGTLNREFCLEETGCTCASDGSAEMESGSRDLIVAGGQLSSGRVVYDISIPEIAFTDGHWEGTTWSTDLTLSGASGSGNRSATESPIEFTIEDGVVTSGSYGLVYEGIFQTAMGAATGAVAIFGNITGCGYSPKFEPTSISIEATVVLADGSSGPIHVEMDLAAQVMQITPPVGPAQSVPMTGGPSTATGFTTWWVDRGSTAGHRVGELDASHELSAMSLAGFVVSEVGFFFDISRV